MTKRARIATVLLVLLSVILVFYTANRYKNDQQKSTDSEEVFAGRIAGVIDFVNTTNNVSAYLTANPVVAGGPGRINAYDVASTSISPVASTSYSLDNQIITTTYRAANYNLLLQIPPTDYVVTASPIRLQNNATYYFGTRDSSSPNAHQCIGVEPLSNPEDSTTCNMEECANLLSARINLSGETTGLELYTGDVSCRIEARVAGSIQATTPANLPMSDLLGSGAVASFLVRSGAEATLTVICNSPLADDNRSFNFSLPPMTMPSCGVSIPEIPIDIPVPPIVEAPPTGSIRGLFDVSKITETKARIAIADINLSAIPLLFDAGTSPDRDNPQHYWLIEDVPVGSQGVYASVITNEGNRMVTFPYLTGNVNGPVIVNEGQITDVDSRFISLLQPVVGKFIAWDPSGISRLSDLVTVPFSNNININDFNIRNSNFIQANGSTLGLLGGASGFRARSYGRLDGTYNPGTGSAVLLYQLDLPGISSIGAPTDGSGTLATPWYINDIQLLGETPDNRFNTILKIPYDISIDSDPASMNEITEIEQADIQACFGEVSLDLRIAPSLGSIFEPSMDFIGQSPSAIEPSPYGSYFSIDGRSNAVGSPIAASDASQQASVSIPLPEGTQYRVKPTIKVINAIDGGEQTLELNNLNMPATGTLGCGSSLRACLDVQSTDGTTLPLSVSIEPNQLVCGASNETLEVTIGVDTGGADVDYVYYTVDNNPAQVILCENCGSNPGPFNSAINFQSLNLLAGAHTLHVEAGRNGGCSASYNYPFYIEESPIQLQCPASITAQANPGEPTITATDPRIGNLTPAVVGGCGFPSPLVDNIPSEFSIGTTTVQFSLFNDSSVNCTTDVTVTGNESYLAVASVDGLFALSITDLSDIFQGIGSQISDIDFSSEGEKIATSSSTGLRELNAQSGFLEQIVTSNAVVATEYKPGSQIELAYVTRVTDENGNKGFQLNVRDANGNNFAQLPTAIIHPALEPSNLKLSWNSDGNKIGVAYNVNTPDSIGIVRRFVFLRKYEISNTSIAEVGTPLLLFDPTLPDGSTHDAELLDFAYTATSRVIATTKSIFRIANSNSVISHVDDNLTQNNVYLYTDLSNLSSGIILFVRDGNINAIREDGQTINLAPLSVVSGKFLAAALQVDKKILAVISNNEVVLLQLNLPSSGSTEIARRTIANLNDSVAFR